MAEKIKCPMCSAENDENSKFCESCGALLHKEDVAPAQVVNPNQNQGFNPNQNQGFNPNQNQGFNPNQNQGFNPNQNQYYNQNPNPNNPYGQNYQAPVDLYGTKAMVFGIIGLFLCFIFSIMAIVYAGKQNAIAPNSSAKAGKILGWVGVGVWIVSFVLGVILAITGALAGIANLPL